MLTDYMEIKDILDNPEEIVELAKNQAYVTKENHYHNQNNNTFFNGIRSPELKDIMGDEKFNKLFDSIFQKAMKKRLVNGLHKINFVFGINLIAYFHIMRERDKFDNSWIHQDDGAVLAGVIYLNPNPKPNTGTIVYKDGKEVIVENEYNKLVMYDTNYMHGPQGGFGEDINDCRLSLVFFVSDFKMKIEVGSEEIKESLV